MNVKPKKTRKPGEKFPFAKGWAWVKRTVHLIRTSRRFRHGSIATVMTAVFFVLMVLLNLTAMKLTERFSFLSPDLTEDQRYTLTDATRQILADVNETVEIDILATEEQCTNPSAVLVT
ncbi:MAG: hypothetical protein IIY93_13380, partial [Clostridia bacterium]|nr:hypothetical protein [Clostridia bacterium]